MVAEVEDVRDAALTTAVLIDDITVTGDRAPFRAEGCHFASSRSW